MRCSTTPSVLFPNVDVGSSLTTVSVIFLLRRTVQRQMGAKGKIVFRGPVLMPAALGKISYLYLELLNFLHWMPHNFHFGAPFESGTRGKLPPLPASLYVPTTSVTTLGEGGGGGSEIIPFSVFCVKRMSEKNE